MGLPAATSFLLIGAALGLATFDGSPRKIAASLRSVSLESYHCR